MTDFRIVTETQAQIEVRRSKFLAFSYPAKDETELRERLAGLRKSHHGAAHVVYAAIDLGGGARFSDDGEPSGTSARPVLDALIGAGCRESMIAVVRYFGGVKLGTGGLSRAYGEAAKAVLAAAPLQRKALRDLYAFTVSLSTFNRCKRSLENALQVLTVTYGERVSLTAAVAVGQPLPDLYGLLGERTDVQPLGTQYIIVNE